MTTLNFGCFRILFDRRRNDRDIKIKIVVVDNCIRGGGRGGKGGGETENGSKDVVQSSVLIKHLSR